MRNVSIGGVPAHKLRERADLEAMVAAFEGRAPEVHLESPAPAPANNQASAIDPHQHPPGDERSIVMELRSIRREAERLIAQLPALGQAVFE